MSRPKAIGNILAELLARRGYARVQSEGTCGAAWTQAAGDAIAAHSRAGQVRRGVLEVQVRNSTLVQELTFEKTRLIAKLAELAPDEKIRDLKFRVGIID